MNNQTNSSHSKKFNSKYQKGAKEEFDTFNEIVRKIQEAGEMITKAKTKHASGNFVIVSPQISDALNRLMDDDSIT